MRNRQAAILGKMNLKNARKRGGEKKHEIGRILEFGG